MHGTCEREKISRRVPGRISNRIEQKKIKAHKKQVRKAERRRTNKILQVIGAPPA